MYKYTIRNREGELLEQTEQADPPDIEALCKKHELGFWKHTHYVEKFKMTTYWCYHGRINIKYIKEGN